MATGFSFNKALEYFFKHYGRKFTFIEVGPHDGSVRRVLYELGTMRSEKVVRAGLLSCSHLSRRLLIATLPVRLLLNFVMIICLILGSKEKIHVYIGVSSFYALIGLFLRLFGRAEIVVYYCYDYYPPPKKLGLKTITYGIFHTLDRLVAKYCDAIWNLTQYIADNRKKVVKPRQGQLSIVVPLSTNPMETRARGSYEYDKSSIVYAGQLIENHGIKLIIEAVKEVSNILPYVKLKILGEGPLGRWINDQIKTLGLIHTVEFLGFVDERRFRDILSRCAIGLAPYSSELETFARYTDPSKIKTYLNFGLAVITTKVPSISGYLEKNRAGIIINYDKSELVDAILRLLQEDVLFEYRQNALRLAQRFDYKKIFGEAMSKMEVWLVSGDTTAS